MEQIYDNCFICGKKNPIGLKIAFNYQDKLAAAAFSLSPHFEGYDGIIHGGIVSAILDEAMAKIILHNNIKAYTVSLNVDFKKPLKPEHPYVVEGAIAAVKRKIVIANASIFDGNSICAAASGKFFIIEKP